VKKSSVKKLSTPFEPGTADPKLLDQVTAFSADRLKANAAALGFLQKHGVTGEAIDRFQVGFSDRTLGYAVPDKNRKAGAEIRGRLRALCILKDTGHEALRGCVTIPILDMNGSIVSLYGRRIDPVGDADLFVGKGGLWNRQPFTAIRTLKDVHERTHPGANLAKANVPRGTPAKTNAEDLLSTLAIEADDERE
jgi:DNA primase-like protein